MSGWLSRTRRQAGSGRAYHHQAHVGLARMIDEACHAAVMRRVDRTTQDARVAVGMLANHEQVVVRR